MNKHVPWLSMILAWVLVIGFAWKCGTYIEENHKAGTGMIDPITFKTPVIKHSSPVNTHELELMKHYIDKATEFDHKSFMAKSPVEESRMQDSIVKYRMLIYNLNKKSYDKGN